MNPHLSQLQAYPFERLRALFAGVTPNPAWAPISLGIGEPRHATPELIKTAFCAAIAGTGLASYPATAGDLALRQSIADWMTRRYSIAVRAADQILPVNGSREALFAFAQTVLRPVADGQTSYVVCPNPFYQIYEGAALLGGATPGSCPRCLRATLPRIGPASPRRYGRKPNCFLCAAQATPRAPSCHWTSGSSFLRCRTGTAL